MAMIPDVLVKLCLTKLADFVKGEICKVLGVKEEIKRFQRRLQRLSPFLQDAEQKRHQDAGVNAWLTDLKEIVYDAEDIIDLCMLPGGDKLLSIQPSSSSSSSAQILTPYSFDSLGSVLLSTSTHMFLLKSTGGGNEGFNRAPHSSIELPGCPRKWRVPTRSKNSEKISTSTSRISSLCYILQAPSPIAS